MESSNEDELFGFSASTQESQEKHAAALRQLEIKQRQRNVVVPTRDEEVKSSLRLLGFPICLFGERDIDRRERLKRVIVENELDGKDSAAVLFSSSAPTIVREEKQTKTFYTEASDDLIVARQKIASYSWDRARRRLQSEFQGCEEAGQAPTRLNVVASFNEPRPITSCSAALNGLVATSSFDDCCRIYETSTTYKLAATLRGHSSRVCHVAFQPSTSPLLASGAADGEVRIWRNDKSVMQLIGHANRISKVVWHEKGSWIASTSYDKTWRLWDLETAKTLVIQEGHSREVYAGAFHPDGALFATSDLGAICRVWDSRSGKTTHVFQGHTLGILTADFACDGHYLATGGLDNQVRIWDLRQKDCTQIIPAHVRAVTTCKFHAGSNKCLVTSSHDRTISVWDTSEWRRCCTIKAHESPILGMDVFPEQELRLTTAGYDRSVKIVEGKVQS